MNTLRWLISIVLVAIVLAIILVTLGGTLAPVGEAPCTAPPRPSDISPEMFNWTCD